MVPAPFSIAGSRCQIGTTEGTDQSGLHYELWDEKWATSGTFKPDFAKWAGCPIVIVPTGLIRHFGFQLTKMKGNRKAGDAYALLPSEMDNIEASLHLDD